jgi:TPR repeat protein
LYVTGDGVAQDPIEAHKWFQIASQRGDTSAQANLAKSESALSLLQIKEAQRRANQWK